MFRSSLGMRRIRRRRAAAKHRCHRAGTHGDRKACRATERRDEFAFGVDQQQLHLLPQTGRRGQLRHQLPRPRRRNEDRYPRHAGRRGNRSDRRCRRIHRREPLLAHDRRQRQDLSVAARQGGQDDARGRRTSRDGHRCRRILDRRRPASHGQGRQSHTGQRCQQHPLPEGGDRRRERYGPLHARRRKHLRDSGVRSPEHPVRCSSRNGRPRPFDTGRNRIHRSGQRSRNGVCRLLHGMERNGENRQIHPYDLGEAGRKCRRGQCRRHRLGRRQYRSQTIILHLWNGPDRPSDVGSAVRNGSGGRPRRRIHGIRHQGVGQHRL